MKKSKQNTERTLNFLNKVFEKTENTKKFNLYAFAKENNINSTHVICMKRSGIVETFGQGKNQIVLWKNISKPSVKMAEDLNEFCSNYTNTGHLKRMKRLEMERQIKEVEKKLFFVEENIGDKIPEPTDGKTFDFEVEETPSQQILEVYSNQLLIQKSIKIFGFITLFNVEYKHKKS